MATRTIDPVQRIRDVLVSRDRSYLWLSRQTGIPYKHILQQVKHGNRPLSLGYAVRIAIALDVQISTLVEETV